MFKISATKHYRLRSAMLRNRMSIAAWLLP
jgi:hypothetical protein